MKSRFISAAVAGAFVLMLSQIAAAASPECSNANCKTTVSVTVTEGTTIMAPAAVDMTSAFPGQVAMSVQQDLSWWSNENDRSLTVSLDGPLTNSVSHTTIAKSDVDVKSDDYLAWTALGSATPVADVIDVTDATHVNGTIEDASTSHFTLRVRVPSATEGNYSTTMTWSVQ